MKIAIDKSNAGFHVRWKHWLRAKGVALLEIDIYDSNAIATLQDADGLMWHHWQTSTRDLILAKRILFALEHSNYPVFPDFKTNWHFDDKCGQKYLMEALGLPMVPSHHFVSREKALMWTKDQQYPLVFKLARGAGSANVRLIKTREEARRVVKTAFGKGFPVFDSISILKERFKKLKNGRETPVGMLKALYHILNPPLYSKYLGRSMGEVYFQEFIPNDGFDIRIIVVGNKAFAIKRLTRANDFRASGSGKIEYDKANFKDKWIEAAFDWSRKISAQVIAYDIVVDNRSDLPFIVEISYGYAIDAYDECPGYWTDRLEYVPGKFDSCEWMVNDFIRTIQK